MKKLENLERMIKLAEEFFGARNDPAQISVTKSQIRKLKAIHPCAMLEKRTSKGPIAWILVFPTTKDLMMKFLNGKINERELLNKTPIRKKYEAIYLCSALVLPEFRRKGIAKKLICKSVGLIIKQHPIKYLFYWEYSIAGKKLANSIRNKFGLPLFKKKH